MKELKDLVAGDEVIVTGTFHRRIAKVDKVTKTQIVIDNARFRRDSGWQCGSDRWNIRRISVPTEKEISDFKEENFRKELLYAISSFNFERLSTDELKQLYNIVKAKQMKKNKHSLKIIRSCGNITLDGYPIATYSNDELKILKNLLTKVLCEVNEYIKD